MDHFCNKYCSRPNEIGKCRFLSVCDDKILLNSNIATYNDYLNQNRSIDFQYLFNSRNLEYAKPPYITKK
jgi:hypothetical protein